MGFVYFIYKQPQLQMTQVEVICEVLYNTLSYSLVVTFKVSNRHQMLTVNKKANLSEFERCWKHKGHFKCTAKSTKKNKKLYVIQQLKKHSVTPVGGIQLYYWIIITDALMCFLML